MTKLEDLGFKKTETARSIVWFAQSPHEAITARHISFLIAESGNKNSRICLHPDPAALSHDMIILEHEENPYPVHRHPTKSETISVLRGILRSIIFDKDEYAQAHDLVSGSIFRIEPGTWHQNVCVVRYVVYHESKRGPFDPTVDNEIAPWEKKP